MCASDGFSVVLSADGDVYTSGKGNFGRLGHGHDRDLSDLTRIDWFYSNQIRIRDIACGGRHCFAMAALGQELYGWGFNFYYQLGKGFDHNMDRLTPVKIDIPMSYYDKIQTIEAGYFNSCVICTNDLGS